MCCDVFLLCIVIRYILNNVYYSVVLYAELIAPYFPVYTNYAILTLMPYSTTLCTSSNSSLDVVLLFNWVMFQSLKEPNKGQYVQSKTGWQCGFWFWHTPGDQVFVQNVVTCNTSIGYPPYCTFSITQFGL